MENAREMEMQKEIKQLKIKIQELNEQIATLKKLHFGPRTEKKMTVYPDVEMSLFDEVEVEAKQSVKEPALEEETLVKSHKRKKSSKGKTSVKKLLELLPKENIENRYIDLPEDEKTCIQCGELLHSIGADHVRDEVVYIPAQIKVIRYYQRSYECRQCSSTSDKKVIVKPAIPRPVIDHSFASPSAVSHVIMQKYFYALPLYRQEQEWKQMGLPLCRATLANWVMKVSEVWLTPIYNRMHELLLQETCLHADETPVQVLQEKGRKNTTKSYMWLYSSGEFEPQHSIRLFEYSATRKGENAVKFLEGYHGYLHTDDYGGYNQFAKAKRCLCWAHARRKFVDAKPTGVDDLTNTLVQKGLDYIGKLFQIEGELKGLSPEERKKLRLEKEKPFLNAFWQWAEESRYKVLPRSKISTALNYALTNREMLETYLKDGKCAISNNLAENSIRPFTVGRKNWLFSGSPKGADASAKVYSIIETCEANGLNVEKYLNYIFKELPKEEYPTHMDVVDKYMPWNPAMQKLCK